jgi:hypothetical protein
MSLPAEVEELIASLKRQIAALQAEVADLRRQLGNTGAFNFIDGLAVDNPTAAANGFGQNQLWLPLITNFSGVGIQEGTSAISPGSASIWQTDSRAACPC